MDDITKKPTLAEKIAFAHDASDFHLFWADAVVNDPQYIPYAHLLGDEDWHLECAVLHEETAIELEEMAKKDGEKKSGCLLPFGRNK
ncbi:hypothetical protein ES703_58788 [subsurface metagenome]